LARLWGDLSKNNIDVDVLDQEGGQMRFEERELKPYGEPVSVTDLKEGSVYFSVTFIDDDMKIPIMQTLVFVGKRDAKFVFQDVESFFEGVTYESAREGDLATFSRCDEPGLKSIFEYEKALDSLMKCSLRRRNKIQSLI
jgi:hypothetical protein